jgi:hypothetical protein
MNKPYRARRSDMDARYLEEKILEHVYSGILLRTEDGEEMGICMRDGGFEFSYSGNWYRAVGGTIEKMGPVIESEEE